MYLYHGTEINRGKRMLKKQSMEYSKGDDHWLGNGYYLYKDKFYAFRWIVIKYKERNEKEKIKKELFLKYLVIQVEIDYNYDRVFSLINPEHRIVFEHVRDRCRTSKTKRMQEHVFTDGVVLNIMFNNLGFGNNYDIVEAVFSDSRYAPKRDSRFAAINEYQLCVKNPKVIQELIDISNEFESNSDSYFKKLDSFDSYRNSNKIKYKYK